MHQSALPPPIRQSEVNLDDELRKIDSLVEEVNQQQQRIRGTPSVSSANRATLDGFEIGLGKPMVSGAESKRSSSSLQESLSSRSGSNDTLGVWDDVSYPEEEEDSGESEELDNEVGVAGGGANGGEMLDSWIRELESGIQGMAGVAGEVSEWVSGD